MNDCAFTHGASKEYCQFCLVKGCYARIYPEDVNTPTKSVATTNEGLQTLEEEKNKDGIFLTGPEIYAIQNIIKMYWMIYNAIDIMGESQIILTNSRLLKVEQKIKEYNKSKKNEEG